MRLEDWIRRKRKTRQFWELECQAKGRKERERTCLRESQDDNGREGRGKKRGNQLLVPAVFERSRGWLKHLDNGERLEVGCRACGKGLT